MYTRVDFDNDVAEIERDSQALSMEIAAGRIDGFTALKVQAGLDKALSKCKGRLFATRMLLADADKRASCDDKKNHTQLCRCRKYHKMVAKEELDNADIT